MLIIVSCGDELGIPTPLPTKPLPENTATLESDDSPQPTATIRDKPTNTAQPTATAPLKAQFTSGTNIRLGPNTSYSVITTGPTDSEVEIIARTEDGRWVNVLLSNGGSGWVWAENVALIGVDTVDEILIAIIVPAPIDTSAPVQQSTISPATSPPQPTSPPPASAICACSGDTLNCSDFSTHAQAQACHNYCVGIGAGDIHGLDGNDNDGLACESLP